LVSSHDALFEYVCVLFADKITCLSKEKKKERMRAAVLIVGRLLSEASQSFYSFFLESIENQHPREREREKEAPNEQL